MGWAIPMVDADFGEVLRPTTPGVLVDARMRKRAVPERLRGLAAMTIGSGPNVIASATTRSDGGSKLAVHFSAARVIR